MVARKTIKSGMLLGWEINNNVCFVAYGYSHIALLSRLFKRAAAGIELTRQDADIFRDLASECDDITGVLNIASTTSLL